MENSSMLHLLQVYSDITSITRKVNHYLHLQNSFENRKWEKQLICFVIQRVLGNDDSL